MIRALRFIILAVAIVGLIGGSVMLGIAHQWVFMAGVIVLGVVAVPQAVAWIKDLINPGVDYVTMDNGLQKAVTRKPKGLFIWS